MELIELLVENRVCKDVAKSLEISQNNFLLRNHVAEMAKGLKVRVDARHTVV